MSLASGALPSPLVSPTPLEEECACQAHAELQIAKLQQALAAAQAQLEFQNHRLLALLDPLPGSAGRAGTSDQAARYDALGPALGQPATAGDSLAATADAGCKALLPRLLEQNPNPVLLLTATGEIRYANAAAQLLGPALLRAAQPSGYLLPLVRKALRTGKNQQQELALAEHWYLLQAVPGPGETCATIYLTDCTSMHCAEQRLAEQREFYEDILNALPIDVGSCIERVDS